MEYLIVKWLHVVSSTILFGTGVGSAYYMLMAGLRGRPAEVHFVARHVVIADWIFTATAVVVQPLTGLWLANAAGLPLSTPWIAWSIALYLVAGACWVPASRRCIWGSSSSSPSPPSCGSRSGMASRRSSPR